MVTDLRIYVVIGIFMISCISLMIFNFGIGRDNQIRRKAVARKVDRWNTVLLAQTTLATEFAAGRASAARRAKIQKHEKLLLKKLQSTSQLFAYAGALQNLKDEYPEYFEEYADKVQKVFHRLTEIYSRKPLIVRTGYTDFLCQFLSLVGAGSGQFTDTLISYTEDSNIHCRTNVLRILCSIGTVQGVGNLLRMISDGGLFLHRQLLTRELSDFAGDKEMLCEHLWSESHNFYDNMVVSLIQFITNTSELYCEKFLPLLQNTSVDKEVRIAMIRYFGRHKFEPAQEVLIDFLDNSADVSFAIVSASALRTYPSPDTFAALERALSNEDWYVRYNASATLVVLGDEQELMEVLRSENVRKKEIVAYIIELEKAVRNTDYNNEGKVNE